MGYRDLSAFGQQVRQTPHLDRLANNGMIFNILELQWGEVPWRGDLLTPAEQFRAGQIAVPNAPGLGVRLNEKLARRYAL